MSQPTFHHLKIAGWRQFAHVDIEFHPRLTIITGANGAGKSTLLNLLSSHLGVSRPYLGVPVKREGAREFLSGVFQMPRRLIDWLGRTSDENQPTVGQIDYSNNANAKITVPRAAGVSYNAKIQNAQPVLGFHMPSHRLMPIYQPVPNLSFQGVRPESAFNLLINETYAGYRGDHTGGSIVFQLKNIIASWAALGAGNEYLDRNPEQLEAYQGLVAIFHKILPPDLGFLDVKIQPPDILLRTKSGTFLMDAASGGILTLIEIASLIYTCSLRTEVRGQPFVVTFDEPENHLHPALQRTLLPTLVDAFPNVQFIVATHSPFMVSSRKESNVYVLTYETLDIVEQDTSWAFPKNSRVVSSKLDYVNRAGSAGEILRQVLGVPVTHPEWVETELTELVSKYDTMPLNVETIGLLRADVEMAGLSDFFSDALVKIGQRA